LLYEVIFIGLSFAFPTKKLFLGLSFSNNFKKLSASVYNKLESSADWFLKIDGLSFSIEEIPSIKF
jgi:hypothetical protein